MDRGDLREQNRVSWNAVVSAHDSHRGGLSRFFSEGGSTLFQEELDLLGELEGRSLVHLQCNSGGDSISLARLGATVTGVDASDEAVSSARDLAEKTGIRATFESADVYDWLKEASREGRRFDVAFASYGVICWLPDLGSWAGGIADILTPAGAWCWWTSILQPISSTKTGTTSTTILPAENRYSWKKASATTWPRRAEVSPPPVSSTGIETSRTPKAAIYFGGDSGKWLRRWPKRHLGSRLSKSTLTRTGKESSPGCASYRVIEWFRRNIYQRSP